MVGITDSDFQSDDDDRRSTSRYVLTLNGGAVNLSALLHVWMSKFIVELGVVPNIEKPLLLFL